MCMTFELLQPMPIVSFCIRTVSPGLARQRARATRAWILLFRLFKNNEITSIHARVGLCLDNPRDAARCCCLWTTYRGMCQRHHAVSSTNCIVAHDSNTSSISIYITDAQQFRVIIIIPTVPRWKLLRTPLHKNSALWVVHPAAGVWDMQLLWMLASLRGFGEVSSTSALASFVCTSFVCTSFVFTSFTLASFTLASTRSTIPVLIPGSRLLMPFNMTIEASQATGNWV